MPDALLRRDRDFYLPADLARETLLPIRAERIPLPSETAEADVTPPLGPATAALSTPARVGKLRAHQSHGS